MAIEFIDNQPEKKKTIEFTDTPKSTIEFTSPSPVTGANNIIEHPFKTVFEPLSKTLTGKSLQDKALDATKPEFEKMPSVVDYWNAVAKNTISGMAGSVADIATTPASYIPIPGAKLIGKIPFKGTTVSEIATRIPVGKGFMQGVEGLGESKSVSSIPQSQLAVSNAGERIPQELTPQVSATVDSGLPLDGTIQAELTPVQKIITALKEAQPIRDSQEHLYSIERAKRAGAIESIGSSTPGEAGFYKQLSSLKGELPKVTFQGIRDKVSQGDIDALFNTVQNHAILSPYEKVSAKNGLVKLLGVEGGGVPNNSELNVLKEVFPDEFIQTVLEKRPFINRVGSALGEAINIPRTMMASFDLSAPLRQGIFMVGRPQQFLPAFGNMFKYFGNEKSYQGLIEDIKLRPTYKLMREAKLPLTDMKSILSDREESFMSRLPEKIPLLGNVIKGSNRAYAGFLNKLRADVFDDLVSKANKQGIELSPNTLKNIGEFVGAATGRGKLPGSLESASVALNGILFSPRLMASRLTMLNPQFYTKLDPFTRKEALKSLFTFSSTASTVLGLASLGGAKIGIDPRSSDFGKIKTGNTRYDVLGGFQQYIKLASQLITGESINSTTNVPMKLGEGYKPVTRMDILGRFIQSKEAPVASFITDVLKGKTFSGENVSVTKEVADRFVPMIIQDMTDLYKEKGLESIGMVLPGVFGVGVQTYKPTPSELVYGAKSVLSYSKSLQMQGRIKEASEFVKDNRNIVNVGIKLEGFQKNIDKLENLKKRTEKYQPISQLDKKELLFRYDQKIKELQDVMDLEAEKLYNNGDVKK